MTQQVQYKFQMPEDMRARLKATAAMNRRSLNQQIVLMLERALASATATTGEGLANTAPAVAQNDDRVRSAVAHQPRF